MPGCAGAGDGLNGAGLEVDGTEAVAGDVGDEESPALGVVGHVVGFDDAGCGGGAAVAGVGLIAVAGEGADGLGFRVDDADAAIEAVDNVEIALGVEGQAVGFVELGLGGGSAVAGEALLAVAGDGGD